MAPRLTLHLLLAALLVLGGLLLARDPGVVLTREGAGLLMILGGAVLMFWTIARHVEGGRE